MNQRLKRGNLVEVLVGHQIWSSDGGVVDIAPKNIGRRAVIEYSYAEKYGGRHFNSYSIIYQDTGSSSAWHELNELKFIAEGGEHLIQEAKDISKKLREEYISLPYIASHIEDSKLTAEGILILFTMLGYTSKFIPTGEFFYLTDEWQVLQPVFLHIKNSSTLEEALSMETRLDLTAFNIEAVFNAFKTLNN